MLIFTCIYNIKFFFWEGYNINLIVILNSWLKLILISVDHFKQGFKWQKTKINFFIINYVPKIFLPIQWVRDTEDKEKKWISHFSWGVAICGLNCICMLRWRIQKNINTYELKGVDSNITLILWDFMFIFMFGLFLCLRH